MSYSWDKTLIKPNSTVKDALEKINNESLRVALVINDEYRLQGVVADGDIRRALLKGVNLESGIDKVMNSSPITVPRGTAKEEIIKLMEERNILFIPVVDTDDRVVGLETLQSNIFKKSHHDNPIFIMAGGFGTRLRPLTDNCPKPMLKVGEKPILEIVINRFIQAGFVNFFISPHYMPEVISQYFGDGTHLGVNITYVYEEEPLGTGGALGLLPETLSDDTPLIMMNGDLLTSVDFEKILSFHQENNADATMCVREYEYQVPYGVVNGDGNRITSMEEKPTHRFFVNAGIYIVSPKIFKSVGKNFNIDMPSLLEMYMKENVLMFPIYEYWLDIGRKDDFQRAQHDIHSLSIG